MILTHDQQELETANKLLFDEIQKYRMSTYMQYVMLAIGITIGIGIGYLFQSAVSLGFFAFYKRSGLDDLAKERFKEAGFDDLVVDEILMPSYEYNH